MLPRMLFNLFPDRTGHALCADLFGGRHAHDWRFTVVITNQRAGIALDVDQAGMRVADKQEDWAVILVLVEFMSNKRSESPPDLRVRQSIMEMLDDIARCFFTRLFREEKMRLLFPQEVGASCGRIHEAIVSRCHPVVRLRLITARLQCGTVARDKQAVIDVGRRSGGIRVAFSEFAFTITVQRANVADTVDGDIVDGRRCGRLKAFLVINLIDIIFSDQVIEPDLYAMFVCMSEKCLEMFDS